MADPAELLNTSHAEYVALEETSTTKHEWLDGVVYDMAGGTLDHAMLQAAVVAELRTQLKGKRCCVFSADLRVRVLTTGLSTYPDLSVICGKRETDPDDKNAAVNPKVLVEILSDSSEAYDRGEKFAHYRRIPSLEEYVLVSQREPLIEVFRKNEAGKWVLAEEVRVGESAALASVGATLSVDEIYADPLRDE